jgi:hypothetical protein
MSSAQKPVRKSNWVNKLFKNRLILIGLSLLIIAIGIIIAITIQNNNRQTASAATCIWSGANSGDFSDTGNWSACPTGSGIPETGDNITFPDVATTYILNNDISITFGSITIEALSTSAYELSGNSIDVTGPIDIAAGTYDFALSTNTASYGITGSGRITVLGGYSLSVGGDSNTYVFSGSLEGSGEFNKVTTGIQTLQNATITSSVITNVTGYFLNVEGSTVIQGELNNNIGGILFNGNTNVQNFTFDHNGGNINVGPGNSVSFDSYNLISGNVGIDASNGTSGQISINGGNTNLNLGTFSMRFFGTYTVGQTFTVINSGGSALMSEFSNFSGGQIVAEGWNGATTAIINDVYISAQTTSSEMIVTIDAIVPRACIGNQTLTANSGNFDTGVINYFANSNCKWTITPANADSVTLNFSAFNTESGNDTVSVYDGLSTSDTLLGTFSGNSIPSSVTANSGAMLVVFSSNATIEASGFNASWTSAQIGAPTISNVSPAFGPTAGGTAVTISGSNFVTGQYQAIQSVGSTSYDGTRGLVVDATGQYITGEFSGTITLGGQTLTSDGGQDIYVAKLDANGNYLWAIKAGGTGDDGYTRKQSMVNSPSDGSLVMTGYYTGSANFGTTLSGGSGFNIFIAKINKTTGAWTWAVSVGGNNSATFDSDLFPTQSGQGIDVDSSGNVYVSGKFVGSSPTFGSFTPTYVNSNADAFFAKLNSSGTFQWVKNFGDVGSTNLLHANGILVDSSGNVYGTFAFNISTTIGATTLTSNATGSSNSAVFKLDSSGNEIWAVNGGTAGSNNGYSDIPYGLEKDSSGNIYISGYIGGGSGTFGSINVTGSATGQSVFLAKLNTSGTWQWASVLAGTGFTTSRDIFIDGSDNIWLGGGYDNALTDGSSTISGNGTNAFFAQYNTSGSLINLNTIGGTGGQLAVSGVGGNQVRAVYEYGGGLYIAGEYANTIGIGAQTITSAGDQDGFFTHYVTSAISVKLGNVEIPATFVNSGQITFTTPASTVGFRDVIVTNTNGLFYNQNNGYEYQGVTIQNSDISSMSCTPTSTPVNTTVNCAITTTVNLNTLSGSVNVRIGAGGSIVNCPVTGSGFTLNCNSIPVGNTQGTFASQYNASGSGVTYANGNNIIVGAAPLCGSGASGTGSNGNTAITDILLCVTAGNLILTSPVSADFTSLTVSDVEQNSAATLTGVTVEDLRGSEAGWSLVCKSSNLTGVTFADTIIPLFSGSVSKFNLTPSALQAVGVYGSTQNGLTDYTTQQNTTSLTNTGSTGESNDFNLAAFASGYGVGKFNKNLLLNLTIPPYIRAQSYVGTLTCSVS